MKLSVIIVNYNTKDLTLKCVESVIRNAKGLDYEIIVVDNGSTERLTSVMLERSDKRSLSRSDSIYRDSIGRKASRMTVKLMRSNENLGFAGGNNLAREFAKGEYVLFLN